MSLRGERRGVVSNGVVLVLIGLVLASVGGYLLTNEGRVTGEAVPVEATVVAATVEETDTGRYYPAVEYRYEYEGRTYTADRLYTDGPRYVTQERARSIVDRYPPGTAVTGYVDADAPARAHLVQAPPSPLYYLFLAGGVLALLFGSVLTADRVFRFGAIPRL